MISDAFVTCNCDGKGCTNTVDIDLTALAGGDWDERYVDSKLGGHGWKLIGDRTYCETCVEEGKVPT